MTDSAAEGMTVVDEDGTDVSDIVRWMAALLRVGMEVGEADGEAVGTAVGAPVGAVAVSRDGEAEAEEAAWERRSSSRRYSPHH